jgi:metal-sulfur cluster biosynthetic enzyme
MNDDILAALKAVIDPELGINIVDLGLVYHAARTANEIDIELTMTTPACPLGGAALASVCGRRDAHQLPYLL